ncbi:ESPR-type extended signal peptide-containing protein [uncultured Veillonella sp.]|uniref:ESPR-type extended signal peptide-containing protein n=1 Tax=uncultured Veillonella sp. TaxID=159268 RepID=UPI0025D5CFB9|nr:ESPR-type extended signal peptide-containing protein [uncultured Veillonella sp.]
MNKIYKIIWSRTKNCYVVASELAKGHTKATSTGKVKEGKLSSAIGLAMVNSLIIPTILFGTAFLGGVGSVDAVGAIDTNQKGIAIKVAGTSSATTTGGYSDIAIGSGATAATAAPPASGGGNGTVAIGYTAGATGAQATAIGYEAKASGTSSEAIGQNASAEGVDAIAIGRAASTAAVQGIVLGADTKATGTGAVAVGAGSVAGTKNTDYNGVAIGGSAAGTINIENKNYDYTIKTTTGGGSFATALGVGATANGQSSLSIGSGYVAPNSENGYTAP